MYNEKEQEMIDSTTLVREVTDTVIDEHLYSLLDSMIKNEDSEEYKSIMTNAIFCGLSQQLIIISAKYLAICFGFTEKDYKIKKFMKLSKAHITLFETVFNDVIKKVEKKKNERTKEIFFNSIIIEKKIFLYKQD